LYIATFAFLEMFAMQNSSYPTFIYCDLYLLDVQSNIAGNSQFSKTVAETKLN